MWKYIARKLLLTIPLLWCVITLIFVLLELSPGDVADKFFNENTPPEVRQLIVAKYRLDDPAWTRYLAMLWNIVRFDFGHSMAQGGEVWTIVRTALPNTLILSFVTLFVIYPTGIVVGTIQAVRHNRAIDTAGSVGTLLFYSMPEFLLAIMLQLMAAIYLQSWLEGLGADGILSNKTVQLLTLPTSGMNHPVRYDMMGPWEQLFDRAKHLILPGVAMGLASAGGTARFMRSSLLEVVRQDFVRTARAKGLRERTVIVRHALRNALLPIVTLMGLSVPYLFSGAVVIETIFAWPGMGRLIVGAINTQDTPLIIACFYVFTVLVVAGNLLADIAYAWLDPRIKYE